MAALRLTSYPPASQAQGTLGMGKIVEQKPIGFPGEKAALLRLGPLFYWAWAEAKGEALIGEHPHQVFEIVSYVLEGVVEHKDSLGSVGRLEPGGAQIMQAGSGMWHEEKLVGAKSALFQIWFEPDRKLAIQKQPTYQDVQGKDMPAESFAGGDVKTVLGPGSPGQLTVDATMKDVSLQNGATWRVPLAKGRALAVMVIQGEAKVEELSAKARDFFTAEADEAATVQIAANGPTRLFVVEVPLKVAYPLYHKARPPL